MSRIKITSGYDFNGYEIQEYLGYISTEIVLGTGFLSDFSASVSDLLGTTSGVYQDKLKAAKEMAIQNLEKDLQNLGGNAIIGLDLDISTYSSNMMGVVAGGTAVRIHRAQQPITYRLAHNLLYSMELPFRLCGSLISYTSATEHYAISLQCHHYGPAPLESVATRFTVEDSRGLQTPEISSLFTDFRPTGGNLWESEFVPLQVPDHFNLAHLALHLQISEYTINGERQIITSPFQPITLPLKQLDAIRRKHGLDAICTYTQESDHWICFCGQRNTAKETSCMLCGRKVTYEVKAEFNAATQNFQALLKRIETLNNSKQIYEECKNYAQPGPEYQEFLASLRRMVDTEKKYGGDMSELIKSSCHEFIKKL